MKAVLVSQFEPKAVGHGGNHRALQIQHDLAQVVGPHNVIVASYAGWQRRRSPAPPTGPTWGAKLAARFRNTIRALRRRVARAFARDLISLAAGEMASPRRYAAPEFRRDYETLVAGIDEPAICVIEHFEFADLVAINRRRGIPTVICIQNIETLDAATPLSVSQPQHAYAAALDFANELLAIGDCDARLFISRAEASVMGGLGFRSTYYPYLPVGEIRQRLQHIRRQRRAIGAREPLFLMVGSGGHDTTRASFEWFVDHARTRGLPGGVRVVVAGSRTERLQGGAGPVDGVELRGWIDQDELDDLLVRATAVLVPQLLGFGALTRLPELACAGIPVIASTHPTLAIDPPPGLIAVDDDWDAWRAQIERFAQEERRDPAEKEYEDWEHRQPSALIEHARSLLGGGEPMSPPAREQATTSATLHR